MFSYVRVRYRRRGRTNRFQGRWDRVDRNQRITDMTLAE
jgi:hypothetical protein